MFCRKFLHFNFIECIYGIDWQPTEGVFAAPIAMPDSNLICSNLQSFPKFIRRYIFYCNRITSMAIEYIGLETTNRCNYACIHCLRADIAPRKDLPPDLQQAIGPRNPRRDIPLEPLTL
ncbi:hypothetical protein EDS67_03480 [candidate division KSB1 bacterium]|nr:MAG: hypothetical protein EDS67_03480 [candidate division KSB1 bacterium]MBC6948285.1 hypothetical protein [candidate division KSB1 bacterium]MCE7939988.1 hypothetical protein [Chlorobi bacterium CHB1]